MDHKYKALLQNIPVLHVIAPIAAAHDRAQQIENLRNLDINNFLILGSLVSIREVLGKYRLLLCWPFITTLMDVPMNFQLTLNLCIESAKEEYFERNFAWHAITPYAGRFTCDCENVTLIFLQPSPDLAVRDRLRLMVKLIQSQAEIEN